MHKRWRNLQNAKQFVGADQTETDYQWAFTKGIDQYINETQQKSYTISLKTCLFRKFSIIEIFITILF